MAKQTFTAGQVLTAAQVNGLQTNDFNQTVSTKNAAYTFVVGDRGTRVVLDDTTARTFTIDDSIFSAGDTIQVHNINTGVLTIAAGSGVTLNGADVLTLQQWQGGTIYFTSASSAIFFPTAKTVSAGGFVRVGGSSFTSAGSVAYDSIFTATYRNYVIIGNVLVSAGTPAFGFQLTSAGTPDTADYLFQTVRADGTSISGARSSAQSSAQVINNLDSTHFGAFTITLYNPQVAIRTAYTNVSTRFSTSTTNVEVVTYGGGHNDAGAFDGIDFLPASGNITGVINIYGVTDA